MDLTWQEDLASDFPTWAFWRDEHGMFRADRGGRHLSADDTRRLRALLEGEPQANAQGS